MNKIHSSKETKLFNIVETTRSLTCPIIDLQYNHFKEVIKKHKKQQKTTKKNNQVPDSGRLMKIVLKM